MRRCLFTLASAVSLLLFVATVVLWVRSYRDHRDEDRVGDRYELHDPLREFYSIRGEIAFARLGPELSSREIDWHWRQFVLFNRGMAINILLPHWSLMVVFAILPTTWVIRWRRKRPQGHCKMCGYNLTGNTSGTCPECGTAIPQASRPA